MTPAEIAKLAYDRHGASQREDELAGAIGLAASVQPAVIAEIGCDRGGTLFCWRQICDAVYGITLPDNSWPTGGQGGPVTTHGAVMLEADSHASASREWLGWNLHGRPVDVLHIDGDHSYDGVNADWEMYSPLVRPGGLVLIHDVLNHWDSRVEVHRWWNGRFPDGPVISSKRSRPIGFGVVWMEEK